MAPGIGAQQIQAGRDPLFYPQSESIVVGPAATVGDQNPTELRVRLSQRDGDCPRGVLACNILIPPLPELLPGISNVPEVNHPVFPKDVLTVQRPLLHVRRAVSFVNAEGVRSPASQGPQRENVRERDRSS